MNLTGALSNHFATDKDLLRRLIGERALVLGRASTAPQGRRRVSEIPSSLLEIAEVVLRRAGQPMRVEEIRAEASALVEQELHPSSIKGALSANLLSSKPRFRRVRRGVYDLVAPPA